MKEVTSKWYPSRLIDLNIINESGGSIENRDTLAHDFCIDAVRFEVPSDDGFDEVILENLDIKVKYSTRILCDKFPVKSRKTDDSTVYELFIGGPVDLYTSEVTLIAAGFIDGRFTEDLKVTGIRFGGHLSNANDFDEVIPDGK